MPTQSLLFAHFCWLVPVSLVAIQIVWGTPWTQCRGGLLRLWQPAILESITLGQRLFFLQRTVTPPRRYYDLSRCAFVRVYFVSIMWRRCFVLELPLPRSLPQRAAPNRRVRVVLTERL